MKLTAIEVLYLHYVNGKNKRDAFQHDFWSTEYNHSPEHLLNRLLRIGAIYESHHPIYTLTQFTVPIIKDLLKKSGIKVSGSKKELIERAALHSDVLDMTGLDLQSVYVVTEPYESFLQETAFINYINFHGPISIGEAYEYYLNHPDKSPSEIIIDVHEKRIIESLTSQNKYDAIKGHHVLSEYYNKELKDIDKSLSHLNQFTMLIILQSIHSYRKYITEKRLTRSYFNIDNYTLEKYRNLLRMKQFSITELYNKLLTDAESLPYNVDDITHSAQFIIRDIIGSDTAEDKLIHSIDDAVT